MSFGIAPYEAVRSRREGGFTLHRVQAELSDFEEMEEEFDEEDFDDDFDDDFEEELDDEYEIEGDDSALGPEFSTTSGDDFEDDKELGEQAEEEEEAADDEKVDD